jgi:hypothetical protein
VLNCVFAHIAQKDTPCLFRRKGGTCKKDGKCDWKKLRAARAERNRSAEPQNDELLKV